MKKQKIIFCPTNIKISFDGGQGIFFVNLETKPFDYEGTFCVKNPQTGKLEGKNEVRKFSRLQFIYNSQKEINNFSAQIKKGQFFEVETSWSGNVKTGKIGGELKEVIWVKEDNPIIKKVGNEINNEAGEKSVLDDKRKLKKWMEENNIEEIILKKRNEVLCKKFNNSGSLSFGNDFVSAPGKELPEVPESLRVKVGGVDMGLFFQKIGQNSITRQELGISQFGNSKKEELKTKNNFSWTPWLTGGGILVLLFILYFWWKRKTGISCKTVKK